jgi:peptidoglycan hydrolase-like protein with peptidoglycan-binding domain
MYLTRIFLVTDPSVPPECARKGAGGLQVGTSEVEVMSTLPPWLQKLQSLQGVEFWPDGGGQRDEIRGWLDFIASTYPEMAAYCRAEKALSYFSWCGLTVAYGMAQSGLRPVFGSHDTDRFLWATAWLEWGDAVPKTHQASWSVVLGDVVVFDFGHGDRHVTLFSRDNGHGGWECWGGNQTHGVRLTTFSVNDVVGVRRPRIGAANHDAQPVSEAWAEREFPDFVETGETMMAGLSAEVIAAAQKSQEKWRVPASITLAQFILESGAGKHMPTGSNNPFGIKALTGQPSVMASTWEEKNGAKFQIVAPFRKFASLAEAFDSHGELLSKHYRTAMAHIDDPDAFADALTGHYATASNYGRQLKTVMRQFNLRKYDGAQVEPDVGRGQVAWITNEGDGDMALSLGSTGAQVTALQNALTDLGYWLGGVDGEFGPLTQQALMAFQKDNNIDSDAVAGSDTWNALKTARPRSFPKDRAEATPGDLKDMGSRVIQHADNTSLTGLLSMILGVLGIGNSIAVNANGGTSADVMGGSNEIVANVNKALDVLKSAANSPGKTPTASQTTDLVKNLQDLVNNINAGAIHTTQPVHSFLDLILGNQAARDAIHNGLESASSVIGSIVPGFGGSILALGFGFAARYFASQISSARTQDFRTGKSIGNHPNAS